MPETVSRRREVSSTEGSQEKLGIVARVPRWAAEHRRSAFVVRSLLLPSVLQLLGGRTWALPSWLETRLRHIAIDRDSGAPAAFEPARAGAVTEPI